MAAEFDAGSFRDRSGRVFVEESRVFRTVMPSAVADFDFVRSTGLTQTLAERGQLIAEQQVSAPNGAAADAVYVLEHPRLPYVSYPYEWSFAGLKAAALLHLDVHLAALERGVTLSDASAYNVQFTGARPIFIDALSFVPYQEGSYWAGHQQFCNQFLNPLLLTARLGIPHHAWYRGALEGIDTEQLNRLLPLRAKLSWNVFTHVALQARFQRKARESDGALKRAESRGLPLMGFKEILRGLRRWIEQLEPLGGRTDWSYYANDNSYRSEEAEAKGRRVAEFVAEAKPGLLFDVGFNTGHYSNLALQAGADYVVGFDFDPAAVQAAFQRAAAEDLELLPLVLDATNPSPGQGWQQAERKGFVERSNADALLALALLHHLVIAKNVPLDQAVGWLTSLAPTGIIEFVQKSDPMVEQLLRLRRDIFDDYDQQSFEDVLRRHARIVDSREVSSAGRRLYRYEREAS